MPSVLITGAGGFVGRALCRRFLAAGWAVSGTFNRTAPADAGVRTIAAGDIASGVDWTPWLSGTDVVVHAAAKVHIMGRAARGLSEFRRVNVQGSKHLAEAAVAAGVTRFVYLSSVKVLGEASGPRPLGDEAPARPTDPYAISKREAEVALERVCGRGLMELAVLRPPLVYGPGVKANFLALLKLADSPWPLPFAAIHNRRSLIYVENLADACFRAAAVGSAQGIWAVADERAVSTSELVAGLRRHMGRPPRLFSVPVTLLRAAARAAGAGNAADRLLNSFEIDSSRFQRDFAWTPPWPFDKGLAETVSWYRSGRGNS